MLLPLKIVHQQNLYLLYPRDLVYGALVAKQLQNVFRYDSCIIFFVSTGNILSWIHMQLLNVFLLFLEGVNMKIIRCQKHLLTEIFIGWSFNKQKMPFRILPNILRIPPVEINIKTDGVWLIWFIWVSGNVLTVYIGFNLYRIKFL